MTIDIISFTDEQFALLSETQIQEVKSVQAQKDKLTNALSGAKKKEKFRLLKQGIFRSAVYELICAALDAEYAVKIEKLKDSLLFYLRFSTKVDIDESESSPYTVDYSLTYQERFNVVKAYYLDAYSDSTERFETFKLDKIAPNYLGEFYSTMHDYLMSL